MKAPMEQTSPCELHSFHASVLALLERCRTRICQLSYIYRVDIEEVYQDFALKLLEHPDLLQKPKAYLGKTLRNMVLDRATRPYREEVDIDMSIDETGVTLAEALPAAPLGLAEDTTRADVRAEVCHAALRKLTLDEQVYICSVFGITAYTPVDNEVRLQARPARIRPNGLRTDSAISKSAYKRLRKDQALLQEVEAVYS